MFALQEEVDELVSSIPLNPSHDVLESLVKAAADKAAQNFPDAAAAKVPWEQSLRNHLLSLVETEGEALSNADSNYYQVLRDRLDLVLVMSELGICDGGLIFTILEEMIETQTLHSCSYVFSWMEDRSARLTKGMEPQKGKALILLRTLNELLRRLSKTAHTTFCGRILTFLSRAFSLGDRSGVNLRGEYGPAWNMVQMTPQETETDAAMEVDDRPPATEAETMAVDDEARPAGSAAALEKSEADKREEFYRTFWSLQNFFSRPNALVHASALHEFQEAVNTVLPVISEANKKERLLMGSKAMQGSTKRRRENVDSMEETKQDYFFAKFLTSPELLDLEMADVLFRRQFVFQLLITLQYLQLLGKGEKAKWHPPRNRQLLVDFTLGDAEVKWVAETNQKAIAELRATAPMGKEFSDTVATILQRERNWISWKNEMCPSFERVPVPSFDETTTANLAKLQEPLEPWEWKYGTEALTELFEMGYRDITELEDPPRYDDLASLVKQIKAQEKRIDLRKKQIEMQMKKRKEAAAERTIDTEENVVEPPREVSTSAPTLAPPVSSIHPSLPAKPGTTSGRNTPAPEAEPPRPKRVVLPKDRQLEAFELTKQKLSWLALRVARNEHWALFAPAKGNPEKMMWLIERNKTAMTKEDEYSFSVTGWVEGDTTIVPPPAKKVKVEDKEELMKSVAPEVVMANEPNQEAISAPSEPINAEG